MAWTAGLHIHIAKTMPSEFGLKKVQNINFFDCIGWFLGKNFSCVRYSWVIFSR